MPQVKFRGSQELSTWLGELQPLQSRWPGQGQDLGLALLLRQNGEPKITEKFDALDGTEEFIIYVSKPCYITEKQQV